MLKITFILSTGGNNDFKKKEFYFIRHGQTDCNISNCKVDHEDVSLNAVGFQQAEGIASVFRNLPIRSICFSPLKRAKETKEIISRNIQANHYEIPELGECSLQVWNDMTACGVNAYRSSHEHVKIFMQKVLCGINQALSYEGPVLIVAHGGIHWATCFKPEYAGKMNFYLSAVDDRLKHPSDNPSIGMILCKTKNNFTVVLTYSPYKHNTWHYVRTFVRIALLLR